MILTPAQRRALQAVKDGNVKRVYSRDGNSYRCPKGIGARAIWALNTLKLIRDGKGSGGGLYYTLPVEVTDAGKRLLWENPK